MNKLQKIFLATIILLLAIFSPLLFNIFNNSNENNNENNNKNIYLPWNVEVVNNTTNVFGVKLGESNLNDFLQIWNEKEMELAIIKSPDEDIKNANLEAYFAELKLGFVLAKVIITLQTNSDELNTMIARASDVSFLRNGSKQITLNNVDYQQAKNKIIKSISIIPTVNLNEDDFITRFGNPTQKIVLSDDITHLLYENKSLDIVVSNKGKEVLQYVSPQNFDALIKQPLNKK